MENKKLIITKNLKKQLIDQIQDVVPDWNIIVGKDSAIWKEHLPSAEIIAGWKKEMLENTMSPNSKLRWVQSWSAGVDSYPLEELAENNIYLTSASGVHANPISETIFALLLGLTRKINAYTRNQVNKRWHHEYLNLEIHHKTIGIIGVGAIGKETAKIAKAFGMKVIGVRNSNKDEQYVDEMVTHDKLNDVLLYCDFVVVTLPLTKQTYQLFGEEQFKRMKPTSYFINIGRGELANEHALTQALQNNEIAGAGLDVFETEPLPPNSPLWEMDNVIVTPHTAGATKYYDERVVDDIFIPNLKDYLSGRTPTINLIDYNKQY